MLVLLDLQTEFSPAYDIYRRVYPLLPDYDVLEVLTVGKGASLIKHKGSRVFKNVDDGSKEIMNMIEPRHLDFIGVCRCYCLRETIVSLQVILQARCTHHAGKAAIDAEIK